MSDVTPLSATGVRKLPEGTRVHLVKAPFVHFVRKADKQWHEVPRMGIAPRTLTSSEIFLLGVVAS